MQTCKFCGALLIGGICPVCQRSSLIDPPALMSATLFDLNPHLKKRLEWRENLRHEMGMPDLPVDPTKLNLENLPLKKLPYDTDLPREKKKEKNKDIVEI